MRRNRTGSQKRRERSRSEARARPAGRKERPSFEGRKRPPKNDGTVVHPSRAGVRRPLPQDEAKTVPPAPISTGVQTVTVSADESGMRLDRFFEGRFPGLSFSHIQRIIRKG